MRRAPCHGAAQHSASIPARCDLDAVQFVGADDLAGQARIGLDRQRHVEHVDLGVGRRRAASRTSRRSHRHGRWRRRRRRRIPPRSASPASRRISITLQPSRPSTTCSAPLRSVAMIFISDTQFLLQAGRRRRVLEAQLLVRLADVERGLRHQRGLVKARQDQLQLARIGVDVADGEDARRLAFELRRVHRESGSRAGSGRNPRWGRA